MESIFFELNNWFSGRDYPYEEPFTTWISERQFAKEDWVEENGLVVVCGPLDMSLNYFMLKNCIHRLIYLVTKKMKDI